MDAPPAGAARGRRYAVDVGALGWLMLAGGVAVGLVLAVMGGVVRDAVWDAVDQVAWWWWDLVDGVRRLMLALGALVVCALAGWAVVALVLPRLV